ncbi:hypothetical protein BCD67_24270 [Oscillatoriales cyanobacterium USR001]|nr:hypothetical protein BCD67_24270 [Oscillatoriales cyanobacterium USR001]
MTTKLNQKVIVGKSETGVISQMENRVKTAQELSATVQPTSVIEIVESAKNAQLKAFASVAMAMLTLTMTDLSQAK